MNDDWLTGDKIRITGSPKHSHNHFYRLFVDSQKTRKDSPAWAGVDWAKHSGMARGDIIKQEYNVVYVRFADVKIGGY